MEQLVMYLSKITPPLPALFPPPDELVRDFANVTSASQAITFSNAIRDFPLFLFFFVFVHWALPEIQLQEDCILPVRCASFHCIG